MTNWIHWLASGLAVVFGVGKDAPRGSAAAGGDYAVVLARERTDLAAQRTYLAVERTLMGWIRTALAMISFGFTIGKIGRALDSQSSINAGDFDSVAYFLLILGTLSLLAASLQYGIRVHSLHAQGMPRQVSITLPVALVLVIIGAVAFAVLAA